LKLAHEAGETKDVEDRILLIAEAERKLIESPDSEFRFHSGLPF
jgi:tRNA-(ms[2]io[6]A)-hydroxylase